MASCRCGEISDVNQKINILTNAQGRIQNASTRFTNLTNQLNYLASISDEAFDSREMGDLKTTITALDDDMVSVRSSFLNKVNSRKNELSGRLSSLRSEDDRYHEEERRRKAAEEAARKAAEAKKKQEAALAAQMAAMNANMW